MKENTFIIWLVIPLYMVSNFRCWIYFDKHVSLIFIHPGTYPQIYLCILNEYMNKLYRIRHFRTKFNDQWDRARLGGMEWKNVFIIAQCKSLTSAVKIAHGTNNNVAIHIKICIRVVRLSYWHVHTQCDKIPLTKGGRRMSRCIILEHSGDWWLLDSPHIGPVLWKAFP